MATSTHRLPRLRDALTIRRRLGAFAVLGVVMSVSAAFGSVTALQSVGDATDRAAELAAVQHHHQDSVRRLAALQSTVLESILVGVGSMGQSPEQLERNLGAATVEIDVAIAAIATIDDDGSIRAQLPDHTGDLTRHVNNAVRLGELGTTDPARAAVEIDAFLEQAAALFDDLDATTAILASAAEDAAASAVVTRRSASTTVVVWAVTAAAIIIMTSTAFALSIARQLRQMSNVAQAMAGGDLGVRNTIHTRDELGALARSFDEMADSFQDIVLRLEREAAQDGFRRQLFDAFDMASDPADVNGIVEEAMGLIGDDPSELLLSVDDGAALATAVVHPSAGAAGCSVASAQECIAVRRGHQLTFASSDAIDACPHLKRRGAACSAVCVPVTFNGESLGVMHTTGPDRRTPEPDSLEQLTALASQTGARLGTIAAFQGAQEKATTDSLTGLHNRRTLEDKVASMTRAGIDYALFMCDLDQFKRINDHYGHEAGDQALQMFASAVRASTRDGDVIARLGGDEFVIVQPHLDATQAVATIERIQLTLAARLEVEACAPFTSSFGISDTTMATGLPEVLRVADAGLLEAKECGRNRWIVGDQGLASKLRGRSDWVTLPADQSSSRDPSRTISSVFATPSTS